METSQRKQALALESWRALRILSEFVDGVETMSRYAPGVAVFGSARLKADHPAYQQAEKCGRMLAEKGFTVITGGGPGIMEAANKGYPCKALVIFPGGFGTLDELFETLTLVQTGKIKKKLPIILYGSEYWSKVLNIAAMAEFGTVSPEDLDLIHISDDVDDAFQVLTTGLATTPQGTLLTRKDT